MKGHIAAVRTKSFPSQRCFPFRGYSPRRHQDSLRMRENEHSLFMKEIIWLISIVSFICCLIILCFYFMFSLSVLFFVLFFVLFCLFNFSFNFIVVIINRRGGLNEFRYLFENCVVLFILLFFCCRYCRRHFKWISWIFLFICYYYL